jgi:hypothetical protein
MNSKYLMFTVVMLTLCSGVFAQTDADMKETITMIKTNLAESKEKLKKYQWIETTTIFLKGEQKSVKQEQCYYGVDGKLVKVETGATTEGKTPGGLRGKIAQNKKDEMADYIKAAIVKIQTYLPPDPQKLQQIYASGKATIEVLEPGKKFKIDFADYNEPGDMLSISVDKANKKIMAVSVNTSVDDPSQKSNVQYYL